jgi:subtilisin-like proprotein convertase family protein
MRIKLSGKLSLVLIFFFVFTTSSKSQTAYSKWVDSVQMSLDTSHMKLLVKQLSGDTSIEVNGSLYTLITRNSYDSLKVIAAEFIKDRFEEYGYTTELQYFDDSIGSNVVATKTGTLYPEEIYVIGAHFDSNILDSDSAPGADDNASGTAAVLEIARLLQNFSSLYTLKFYAWDFEEQGLTGSQYSAQQSLLNNEQIKGVLNLDVISWDSNNDYKINIATNYQSQSFANEFNIVTEYYQPILKPVFTKGPSDHIRYWEAGLTAIGVLENIPEDLNPFMHTTQDLLEKFNLPYYYTISKSASAFVLSNALNYQINFEHEQLSSGAFTDPRETECTISSFYAIGSGVNEPRLYYSTDSINFISLTPFYSLADTFKFMIPALPIGTEVLYYFAAQDSLKKIVATFPTGGRGFDPPGSIKPENYFRYVINNIYPEEKCFTGPLPIPANQTTIDSLYLENPFKVFDLDVIVDISHKNTYELNLKLIGPDQTEVLLADDVDPNGDNFTQTIFNDDATISILDGTAPFTGEYKPIEPLSIFYKKLITGNWKLKIMETNFYNPGVLNSWCLHFRYIDTTLDVENHELSKLFNLKSYPNPTSTCSTIEFILPESEYIELNIYDMNGREIRNIIKGIFHAGNHGIVTSIEDLAPGVYFFGIDSEKMKQRSKVIKMK